MFAAFFSLVFFNLSFFVSLTLKDSVSQTWFAPGSVWLCLRKKTVLWFNQEKKNSREKQFNLHSAKTTLFPEVDQTAPHLTKQTTISILNSL